MGPHLRESGIGSRVTLGGARGGDLALELAVAEGAGLLDVEPLLQTAGVEEVAAGRDHRLAHVLQREHTWLHTALRTAWTQRHSKPGVDSKRPSLHQPGSRSHPFKPCRHSGRRAHLVADGADVVVLLQLEAAGRGQALDLVDGVAAQQEAKD